MTDTFRNDRPSVERSKSLLKRIPDPTYLSLLFLLGIPGVLVPSLEWMTQFFLFGLFALWPMLRGFLPSRGSDEEPTDWIQMGTQSKAPFLVSMLYVQVNLLLQAKGLLQLLGHVPILVRHRLNLPTPETFDQQAEYTLPVEGEWTVVNGGPTREDSHSWGILTQRYAYDFVMTDDAGKSYEGDGDSPEDFYCYGEPIVAPAEGVVVESSDGHRDYHRTGGWLDPLQRDPRGNWVTIEHADGEYSVFAHLQEDSVQVSEGEKVTRGQQIGRCGHSGNSTEPHLHFHVQDRRNFFLGMGLPVYFDGVTTRDADGETTTHEHAYLERGQRVERAN